jgi:hypothetical protein
MYPTSTSVLHGVGAPRGKNVQPSWQVHHEIVAVVVGLDPAPSADDQDAHPADRSDEFVPEFLK